MIERVEILPCESERLALGNLEGFSQRPIGFDERWTAKRGAQFGVSYAEGFRQYTGTPYPRSKLLQDLAGANLLAAPRTNA